MLSLLWWTLLVSIRGVVADRVLTATSLVSCMEDSDITPEYFDVTFNADTAAISYDIEIVSALSEYVYASVSVYAFGLNVIHENINFCSISWKQFCPMTPGTLEIDSVEYISDSYVNMIPGAAFTFPDLDAQVRLILTDSNGTTVGCLQASFSNGKTVSHMGAKWATAVVAGLGLLISGFLSLYGNSASASRMSAMSISLFTYFQSVVIISMLHVEKVPPICGAWSENLAWSMGLIRVGFMQKIIRWYVQATGGTPTQYLTSTETSVLVQRSWEYTKRRVWATTDNIKSSIADSLSMLVPQTLKTAYQTGVSLYARDSVDLVDMNNVQGSKWLVILRGIDRVGYKANIEPTAVVSTGITFFVLCLYVLLVIWFLFRLIAVKSKSTIGKRTLDVGYSWAATFRGVLGRYIYIGFPQLVILSLWEFMKLDSPAVIVCAALFLILSLATMGWSCYKVIRYGKESVQLHRNAAAILYGNEEVLKKYGYMYSMLDAQYYYLCALMLGHILVKGIFVALAAGSGRAQSLCIFLLDIAYTIYMGVKKPYLDKPTNIMSICINSVMTVNSFFFVFYSGLFGTPPAVASIMGLVFFVLNAAFSLMLLLYVIFFACVVIFSKNPDAKFSPAKDDRASFRRKHQSLYTSPDGADELMDLGQVARGHDANWAAEMYKLRDMQADSSKSSTDIKEENVDRSDTHSIGDKIKSTLTRGKSLLSRNGTLKRKAREAELRNAANTSETEPIMQKPEAPLGHDRMTSLSSTGNQSLYNDATTPAKYNYL